MGGRKKKIKGAPDKMKMWRNNRQYFVLSKFIVRLVSCGHKCTVFDRYRQEHDCPLSITDITLHYASVGIVLVHRCFAINVFQVKNDTIIVKDEKIMPVEMNDGDKVTVSYDCSRLIRRLMRINKLTKWSEMIGWL